MKIGMHTEQGTSTESLINWKAAIQTYGPLRVPRLFRTPSEGLPAKWADIKSWSWLNETTVDPYVSFRPDTRRLSMGLLDTQIREFARSIPAVLGREYYITVWHEPEGLMHGDTFKKMFDRFYSVFKAANPSPSIHVGATFLSYHWLPNAPATRSRLYSWRPAISDFLAMDVYSLPWEGGNNCSLADHPGFQRWLGWCRKWFKQTPILVAERGILNYPPGNQAEVLGKDLVFLEQNPDVKAYVLWGTDDPNTGDWAITDPDAILAVRAITERFK